MPLLNQDLRSYEEFHKSIVIYNKWFIKLRYLAVAALILFFIAVLLLFDLDFTTVQITAITGTSILILTYNVVFDFGKKNFEKNDSPHYSGSFKLTPLRFSLLQIILDLVTLSIIVYFTGGIETPIFMFYIFHMIIGALILHVFIVYTIAGILIAVFTLFSLLEYLDVIPHQSVQGLYSISIYNDLNFIISYFFVFGFTLFISIKLTDKIVKDLYRRERHLKNALDELNEAENSKQKYVMGIVHELKSPIAASISYLDLLKEGYIGELPGEARGIIQKVKSRLQDSIDDINGILRVSRFKLLNKTEKEEIDIYKIIEGIIEKSKPVAERKNIKFEFLDERKNKKAFFGDNILINLALSNLIGNALKYTKEGNVRIELINNKENVIIEISDTGIGIPKDEIDKIFADYYRASNAVSGRIEGTGTGMQVVKDIVNSHNGNIELESPSKINLPGKPGTTVKIKIPLDNISGDSA